MPQDFPWGVIAILGTGLVFVLYIIYYILRLANEEMKNEEHSNHSINDKSSH
jgi:hypothetical protein